VSAMRLICECSKALLRYRLDIAMPASFRIYKYICVYILPYNVCASDKDSFVSAIGLFCECGKALLRLF